jgi:uncharacterized protein with ParB-like and HNH nuclease domain
MTTTADPANQNRSIDGKGKTIKDILFARKFYIDYYQREFKWQRKQLEELINDLTDIFLTDYKPTHERRAVSSYNHYFLGSIIISRKDGRDFVIDGQQRLTTLTLLLLFLMKKQQTAGQATALQEMIFSEEYGEKSFNIDVLERRPVMQALFEGIEVDEDSLPESNRNISTRYKEIEEIFPDDIDTQALPYFVDWLTKNVHLVEITAYSDDVAYTIFETMNDRGLSLSPTDMLKGYLLANISSETDRNRASSEWKRMLAEIRALDPDNHEGDSDFFKAWLRSQYAESIRERKKNAVPGEWDRIGSEYHRWVRDQAQRLGLKNSDTFRDFIVVKMTFFSKWYVRIREAEAAPTDGIEDVYHNASHQFTHQPTLLLSALSMNDSDDGIRTKLRLIAKYADIFLARRLCNSRNIDYSTLQYYIFTVVRDIRGKSLQTMAEVLKARLDQQEEKLDGFERFYLNKWSHKAIKRILARMIDFVEVGSGGQPRYQEYVELRGKAGYEVEHIWANHFEDHADEFGHKSEFEDFRDRFGDLLLLPKSFNASYGDKPYSEKVEQYFQHNVLARSLNARAYQNNPGFRRFLEATGLPFKALSQFKKSELESRQSLYSEIAKQLWDEGALDRIVVGEESPS